MSPFHGTRSSPGKSLSNFTQCTTRAPGFAGSLAAGVGVQDSSAIVDPPKITKLYLTAQRCKFLGRRRLTRVASLSRAILQEQSLLRVAVRRRLCRHKKR